MSNKAVYLIMRGVGRFFSDFKPNIISLITLCTLVFVYHLIFTTSGGASLFLQHISEVKSVRVYLKKTETINTENLKDEILRIKGVASVEYFSPADAKAFVVKNAPNVSGMKSFAEEFFPAFMDITPQQINNEQQLDEIVLEAEKLFGVESVSYGKDVMTRFLNVSRGATFFLILITCFFTLSVSFVLYNTAKLSLYKFREEIRLYSLVGATKAFVSTPFAVSAFLNGCFAFFIGSGCFYLGLAIFNEKILYPSGINIFGLPDFKYFSLFFVAICVISLAAAKSSVNYFLAKLGSINDEQA